MNPTHQLIRRDSLIWKFSFYGLLKNLKFFEPFLLIFLLNEGISLTQVGILYAVREIITFIFEVPSGIFADAYGKRKELTLCFLFYIAAFVAFYLGTLFWHFAIAMLLFGFGEAFRSGTHKAIILAYLEEKGWFAHKNFVYGRTRSFSLIGSAVSAFASVLLLVYTDSLRSLFLLCTIPYILDFVLVLSYPKRFDAPTATKLGLVAFWQQLQQLNVVSYISFNVVLLAACHHCSQ